MLQMLGDGPENKELELIIRRRVLNNSDLFSKCPFKDRRKSSLYSWARSRIERFNFGKCLRSTFPLYSILSTNYDKRLLLHDIIAGLTVSSLHVPQGKRGNAWTILLRYGLRTAGWSETDQWDLHVILPSIDLHYVWSLATHINRLVLTLLQS